MARIVKFFKTGGPEVLQIIEEPVAAPAAGELQISVRAIGVNRAEVMCRNGPYLEVPPRPALPGH